VFFCTSNAADYEPYAEIWADSATCSGAPLLTYNPNVTSKECEMQNCNQIKFQEFYHGETDPNCTQQVQYNTFHYVEEECVLLSNNSDLYYQYVYTPPTLTFSIYNNDSCSESPLLEESYSNGCYTYRNNSITFYRSFVIQTEAETTTTQVSNHSQTTKTIGTTTAARNDTSTKKSGLQKWKIAVIVIACIIAAILIALLVWFCFYRNKNSNKKTNTWFRRNWYAWKDSTCQ